MTSTQIEQALKLAENYANGIFDENKKKYAIANLSLFRLCTTG